MVLVIGGAGYIGANVVNQLIKSKYAVVVVDDLSTGFQASLDKSVKFIQGQIEDEQFLKTVFKTYQFKSVIHLAAKLLVGESVQKPLEYFATNVGGVISLLKVMQTFGVKNLIFSSTAAVYGTPEYQKPLLELDHKDPINPYGSSKLSAEYLIKAAAKAYGINYVIFRYFNVAGADLTAQIGQSVQKPLTHLIPILVNSLLNPNVTLKVYGHDYQTPDRTCVRDYIHVLDLAKAHLLGLEYVLKHQSGTFNLGLGHGYSIKEVIDIAAQTLALEVKFEYADRRLGDPPFLVANSDKAKKALGFEPEYNLTDMIKSEYKWRKNAKY